MFWTQRCDNKDEIGYLASQVDECVHLDCRFCFAKVCPRTYRQTQINCCVRYFVNNRVRQMHANEFGKISGGKCMRPQAAHRVTSRDKAVV